MGDNSNQIIEEQLKSQISELGKVVSASVITFIGPIWGGIDSLIRQSIEEIAPGKKKHEKLTFILETTGGRIEPVERIARTLRHHYKRIEFIVPNFAYSAGTVLVMCGDSIYMDYFSVLGPIDPQIEKKTDKKLLPAIGYLEEYERLVAKSVRGQLSTAELAYLLQRFDPAELYQFKQAKELSVSLLREWLVKYKFKNWRKTATRKLIVDKEMKIRRAEEIANKLNTPNLWHTHGRGIHMDVLRRNLKLQIEDFGTIDELNRSIRDYYSLLTDYMFRRRHSCAIHTAREYRGFSLEG